MTKETFIKELVQKLKKLPQDEIDSAADYYTEYFDEAGVENANEVIKKLGSPSQVASQILADYAFKSLDENPKSTKKGISAVWFILLAILATPIALPLLLLIILPIFIFFIISAALSVSFLAIAFSLVVGGIASIVAGFAVMTEHMATSMFFIGTGLSISGIGLLLFSPIIALVKKVFITLAKWLKKAYDKITKKKEEKSYE